jgi:hypothetical protein
LPDMNLMHGLKVPEANFQIGIEDAVTRVAY